MNVIILKSKNKTLIDTNNYNELNKHNWYEDHDGYACTRLKVNGNFRTVRMHRLIMNAPKNKQVDHINGNRLDNRKENLRIVTHNENTYNRKPYKRKTSKYKGVHLRKDTNKWSARITYNQKTVSIGSFINEKEAAKAYNEAAKLYFGEFAYLNEVDNA